MIWFTADLHLGHFNIIKYTKRPFKNIEEMDDTLIQNWNKYIDKHDIVIYLGDFCYKDLDPGKYLDQLNGHITFIKGNHDNPNSLDAVIDHLVLVMYNIPVFCVHNPLDFSNSYRLNLVGHVHDKWKVKKVGRSYLVNVGIDVWNYCPVTFMQILKAIEVRENGEKEKKE